MTTSVIEELSERLQRSLDRNYNVIDLVEITDIFRILENTPITSEQLTTTRLAYHIQQLRRNNTNDEQLKRQAKRLLKKWRDNLLPAGGAQPAVVPPAAAVPPNLTNGVVPVGARSKPTTPQRLGLLNSQRVHHQEPQNCDPSSSEKVITIPDDSQGSSYPTSPRPSGSRTTAPGGGGGGVDLLIPNQLTNFYMNNKKIIDGSEIRVKVEGAVVSPPTTTAITSGQQRNNHVGDEDRGQRRKAGRKKGSRGVDGAMAASSGSLNSSTVFSANNSNSGFGDSASATGNSVVGKKVKTTRQLVADLKYRNEQNLRNASYADLSNDEHNNNHHSSNLSSPMSASNDSHQTLFQHHHHNHSQHPPLGHDVFHSAPVTPSNYPVQRQVPDDEGSLSARKREKKRKRMEREAAESSMPPVPVPRKKKVQPPLSGMNFLNQVDEEIWQLRNQLPPIDRKAILRQMKAERIAQTQVERQCMCQLVECSQEEAERACGVIVASLDDIPAPSGSDTLVDSNSDAVNATPRDGDSSGPPAKIPVSSSSVSTAPRPLINVVRNKKSIFDDDDGAVDEAEESMPTNSPGNVNVSLLLSIDKNNNSEEEGTNPGEDRFAFARTNVHFHGGAHQQQQHPDHIPAVIPGANQDGDRAPGEEEEPRVFYKFIEEPNCPVMKRKTDLGRLNPDYHLAALHQLYVPEVNGNWSTFSDLDILRRKAKAPTVGQIVKANARLGLKRKRRRSSSDESSASDSETESSMKPEVVNTELIKCLERLQDTETINVQAVVPLLNPFYYFLQPQVEDSDGTGGKTGTQGDTFKGNALVHMAGSLPRHVPLRTDFGVVVVPPPVVEEGSDQKASEAPQQIRFNRELAKELGIEGVREGHRGDVYDPKELSQFLEATLRQRLPKFQMANLFYKRSWPGAEDRERNLSLELLNSLYLNRVLEFRRRRRERMCTTHRKRRRRSSDGGVVAWAIDGEEEIEVCDVHVFDGFLEMQTMAFRNGPVAAQSARRLFYVNDDRLFGHQPSILDEVVEGPDRLPLMDDWDLFRVRWQSLEFLPPVLSATARLLYSSWPRMRWNFLLDYFKDRQMYTGNMLPPIGDEEEEEEEGGEVVRIHENNFRLPSFNHLTEENMLGIRQRRGRVRRMSESDDLDVVSGLPERVQWRLESFRERDFVRVCLAKWPQLFEGVSFDYEQGLLEMQHGQVDARWRFLGEFRDLLKEVTRLGVAAEDCDEDEDIKAEVFGNGMSETNMEVDSDAEGGVGSRALRTVDVPQVELFKEWHESVQVSSYNDELLTILPYVVID